MDASRRTGERRRALLLAFLFAGAVLVAIVPTPATATTGGPANRSAYTYIDSIDGASNKVAYAPTNMAGSTNYNWGINVDGYLMNLGIGFTFKFYGTDYTQINAAANGFLGFGTTNYAGGITTVAIPTEKDNVLMPFYADLDGYDNFCTGPNALRFKVTGTAPARLLTIQYTDMAYEELDPSASVCGTTGVATVTFQVKLFETSNIIEYHYVSTPAAPANTYQAQLNSGVTVGIEKDNSNYMAYSYSANPAYAGRAIRFRPANTAPAVADDGSVAAPLTTLAGVALDVDVRANDIPSTPSGLTVPDIDNANPASPNTAADNTIATVIVSQPTAGTGTAAVDTDGSIIYTPAAGFGGTTSFTYRLDNQATFSNYQSATATVYLSVEKNDPPVNTLPPGPFTVKEANVLALTGVSVADPDAGTASINVRLKVDSGTLAVNTAGVSPSGTIPGADFLLSGTVGALNTALSSLSFTPTTGQCGTHTLTMTSNDLGNTGGGGPLADTDTRTITVTDCIPPNEPPTASSFSVTLVAGQKAAGFTLSGSDPDNSGPLTYEVLSIPMLGFLGGAEPDLTITRSPGSCGADSLTYRVIDAVGAPSPTATVSFTLLCPPNQPPTVQDLGFDVKAGKPRSFTLLATDLDGGTPSTIVVTSPSHGSLSGNPPALTYTPVAGYCGYDSFLYVADDGQASSDPGEVTLRVVCTPNMAPVAEGDGYVTGLDRAVATPLFAYDPEDDALLYMLVSAPEHGELQGTMPLVTYDPHSSFSGVDRFTYRVFDGELESGLAIVTIEVQPAGSDDSGPAEQPGPAADSDADGFSDAVDNCPSVPSPDLADTDGDGVGDVCDPSPTVWGVSKQPEQPVAPEGDLDADGDGVLDARDLCPSVHDPGQVDFDGDRRGDLCDSDRDGDTIPNGEDNCKDLASTDLSDLDADGSGDPCDEDDDNDGLPDTSNFGRPDNCPRVANPAQQDADSDMVGDVCDADVDGSGSPDARCASGSCQPAPTRSRSLSRVEDPSGLGPLQAVLLGTGFAVFAVLVGFTLWLRRK